MGSITFEGYSFDICTLNTNFPSIAGVYVFLKEEARIGNGYWYTPLYFGITDSFATRFHDHHKLSLARKNGCNCIGLLCEPDKQRREHIEKLLLSRINTVCNEQLNSGIPTLLKKVLN